MNKIEFTLSPQGYDVDFLTSKLNEENPGYTNAYPFAFFVRDKAGNIIGGLNGFVIFGEIYTDQLWVHKDYRNNGLGKELMNKVFAYGKEVGCSIATISTMSFQGAVDFYKKLGYEVDFERSGYENNSKCIYLIKKL